MIIRDAQEADLSSIKDIWNYYIRETTINYDSAEKPLSFFEELLAEKKRAGNPFLVFEVDNEVLGYATYNQFRARSGYKYSIEHGLYFKPNITGKGYGSALFDALIAKAKEQGYHTMIAGIDASNEGSVRFHLKRGFEMVGTFKDIGRKNNEWLDCVFLQLML